MFVSSHTKAAKSEYRVYLKTLLIGEHCASAKVLKMQFGKHHCIANDGLESI